MLSPCRRGRRLFSYQSHRFEVSSLTTVDFQWDAFGPLSLHLLSRWANTEHTLHRAIAVVVSECLQYPPWRLSTPSGTPLAHCHSTSSRDGQNAEHTLHRAIAIVASEGSISLALLLLIRGTCATRLPTGGAFFANTSFTHENDRHFRRDLHFDTTIVIFSP